MRRQEFGAASATAAAQTQDATAVVIDPNPLFEISPLLYMLGTLLGIASASITG